MVSRPKLALIRGEAGVLSLHQPGAFGACHRGKAASSARAHAQDTPFSFLLKSVAILRAPRHPPVGAGKEKRQRRRGGICLVLRSLSPSLLIARRHRAGAVRPWEPPARRICAASPTSGDLSAESGTRPGTSRGENHPPEAFLKGFTELGGRFCFVSHLRFSPVRSEPRKAGRAGCCCRNRELGRNLGLSVLKAVPRHISERWSSVPPGSAPLLTPISASKSCDGSGEVTRHVALFSQGDLCGELESSQLLPSGCSARSFCSGSVAILSLFSLCY